MVERGKRQNKSVAWRKAKLHARARCLLGIDPSCAAYSAARLPLIQIWPTLPATFVSSTPHHNLDPYTTSAPACSATPTDASLFARHFFSLVRVRCLLTQHGGRSYSGCYSSALAASTSTDVYVRLPLRRRRRHAPATMPAYSTPKKRRTRATTGGRGELLLTTF